MFPKGGVMVMYFEPVLLVLNFKLSPPPWVYFKVW